MIALFCLCLTLFASPFKSRSQLEAENAALRQQLIILQRKVRRSCSLYEQRSPVLHPAVSLVSVYPQDHHDHPARDPRALASCWLSALLALEISLPGRASENRCGPAGVDPTDER